MKKITMKDVIDLSQSYSINKRLAALGVMIARKNVPLILNSDGGSYTDGHKIVIGIPKELTQKMLDDSIISSLGQVVSILKALTLHEVEHIRSSSFKQFAQFKEIVEKDYRAIGIRGAGQVIGQGIMNGVEDGRIERRIINRLPGGRKHIQFMNAAFFRVVGQVQMNLLRDFLLSICTISTSNLYLMGWSESYKGDAIAQLLEDILPLIKEGVASETPEGCYDACIKIHELSFPVLKEYIQDNLDQFQGQGNYAEDGDIDRNPSMDEANRSDAPGNKEQQYSNTPPQGCDQGQSQGTSGASQEFDEGPKELTPQELEQLVEEINNAIYEEVKKNLEDSKNEDAKKEKADKIQKARREKNQLSSRELRDVSQKHQASYKDFFSSDPIDPLSKQRSKELEKTLLRILRNKKSEELRYRRSGNIDKRSLLRFVMNKESDVFYKAEKNEVDDAAFYVLIDHSGSMNGDNMKLALTSASVIQEAIQAHFPLRVVGFNSDQQRTRLYDYKDFDEKSRGSMIRFVNNANHANCDGFAIRVASKEIQRRSERIKVLFVLSDGYPTVRFEKDPIADAKAAVAEAKKKGIIVIPIVFGVDNCDRGNFETIYEKNIVMCQPIDIEKNLSKLIEKIVRVG